MKISANDIFKVKTQENLTFIVKTGQDKPKPKFANKPKIRKQTQNSEPSNGLR